MRIEEEMKRYQYSHYVGILLTRKPRTHVCSNRLRVWRV